MSFHRFQLLLAFICALFYSLEAFGYDSMLEFEGQATGSSGLKYMSSLNDCFSSGQVVWPTEVFELNNIYIPGTLNEETIYENDGDVGTRSLASSVGRGAAYLTLAISSLYGGGGLTALPALIALGIEYTIMVDICTNAYIVAPHEYISQEEGLIECKKGEKSVGYENVNKNMLTDVDVPFFYSCDPTYDPITDSDLSESNEPEKRALIGNTWGYMGAASPHCVNGAEKYARKKLIGKVFVEYIRGTKRFWSGYSEKHRCTAGKLSNPIAGVEGPEGDSYKHRIVLEAGKQKYISGNSHYYAHYRYNSLLGKIQMCVVTPYTLFPIRVGCSYVPPPGEATAMNSFLRSQVADTRCLYFIEGRADLHALGHGLADNYSISSVSEFLKSEMHMTSTVVGCIKDLLVKAFIAPKDVEQSFFYVVQKRMEEIVLAFLIIYVSIVGIRIISSPQEPNRGQLIMYVLKFALVVYFSTTINLSQGSTKIGTAWYHVDQTGQTSGLYPMLLNASEIIASFFLQAQTDFDYTKMCYLSYGGGNILDNRIVQGMSDGIDTIGFNGVRLTVWDLIDCKIINYLNYGSCKYSLAGVVGLWIVGAALLVTGVGLILALLSFMYAFILLLIIFKTTHIFILSLFVITILVLIAPLIICLSLFEATKSIFQAWFKMILGYALYPGVLFAFIAIMLATFDVTFYGDIDKAAAKNGDFRQACKLPANSETTNPPGTGVSSLFCMTVKYMNVENPCKEGSIGHLVDGFIERKDDLDPAFRNFHGLYDDFKFYLPTLLKMAIFTFLFYIFLGGIDEFVAVLVGVHSFGSHAKGVVNLIDPIAWISGKTLNTVKQGTNKTFNLLGGK